jgi:hypothetical protein
MAFETQRGNVELIPEVQGISDGEIMARSEQLTGLSATVERRFTMPTPAYTDKLGSTSVSALLGKHAAGYFERCEAASKSELLADIELANTFLD